MPSWPGRFSLRAKLVLLVLLACVVPLGIAAYLDFRATSHHLLRAMEDLLGARGDQIVRELDNFHRGHLQAATRLSLTPGIADYCSGGPAASAKPMQSAETAQAILAAFPPSDADIRGVGLLDAHGRVLLGTEPALQGVDLSYRPHVQAALQGRTVISDVYFGAAEAGETPSIAYLVPIKGPNSQLLCVVTLRVRAAALWRQVQASNALAGSGSFAVIFDSLGIRIAHTYSADMHFHPAGPLAPELIEQLVVQRRFGARTRELLQDVRAFPEQFERARAASPASGVFLGLAPVNQSLNYGVARRFTTVPWTVFYMVPSSEFDTRLSSLKRERLVLAAAMLGLAAIVGFFFAGTILRPIRALSAATRTLAEGRLDARVPAAGNDELGELGRHFNAMGERIQQQTEALQGARDDLDARVARRTSELEREINRREAAETALKQAYDELRLTQEAVMQQERLRALSQMASGIAHDINNAISPIMLYTDNLLEREPNLSARARSRLETIARAIDEVAATVARMREFSRPRESGSAMAQVALNPLVQQVVELTRARWSDMPQQRGMVIRLRIELDPALPPLMGMESELREALIKLVFNAVDAMPHGGTLTLRTTSVSNEAGTPCAQLEVQDNGIGMSEETRRRCLEPFFTTKGDRGTGLGLAIVYGTVKRHEAELDIHSEPGHGTTVTLRFAPVIAAPVTLPPADGPMAPPQALRLLLIDDDAEVLRTLQTLLQIDGHEVVAASGGQQGIEAFSDRHARGLAVDIVITDLGMPYVDGRAVAREIKQMSPTTPVILLTGWGQAAGSENGGPPPCIDLVLGKPPKLRELRQALARFRLGIKV